MSLFKDMLKENESLFTPIIEALDFDYLPKILPFREKEQRTIAACIAPIFQKRNGKNIIVYGKPGIGKTAATKHVLKDLEDQTDEILPVYINCWQKNTTYKILLEICEQLNYKFTQNKKTEELMSVVKEIVNKNMGAVFVFDEIDKVEDLNFLYILSEELYRKTIIMITNYKEWFLEMDERTRSRILPEMLEFKEYNALETTEILRQRMKLAFVSGVWQENAFILIANKASEIKDIRTGLYLLKEAGERAESKSNKTIQKEDAEYAIGKLANFTIKNSLELDEGEKELLSFLKTKSGRIGDLFKEFIAEKKEGKEEISYKTFQRRVKKLEENKFINVEKVDGGKEGSTSIIKCREEKKLTDFE